MDILTYTLKWSEVILRWGHVLFAILWVGNSFLFNYLDNKLNKRITSRDIDGEGYLMHSGFFYKLTRLKKSPEKMYQMHRDEALEAFKIWEKKEDKIKY